MSVRQATLLDPHATATTAATPTPSALSNQTSAQPRPALRPVPVIDCAGLVVDRRSWVASVDGRALPLTYLEFQVLDFFVRNPDQVFSRAALQTYVWGHRSSDPADLDASARRSVDVLIARLRRKLGPGHRARIETVRQVGYRFRGASAG
jgi:DNA-binding response OmpR family regulator